MRALTAHVRRAIAAGAALAALGVAAASCRTIVAGEPVDAVTTLCGTLRDCYGEAFVADVECDALDDRLELDPATFLSGFEANGCGETCAGSRACLSLAPVCESLGNPCKVDAACCESALGHSACVGGACCLHRGVACAPGGSECCDAPCRPLPGTEDYYCGGVKCGEVGEDCDSGFDCCTGHCSAAGECEKDDCSDLSEPCTVAAECCQPEPTEGVTIDCIDAKCTRVEACSPELGPCDPLLDGADCCQGTCYPGPSGFVCVSQCLEDGFDCADSCATGSVLSDAACPEGVPGDPDAVAMVADVDPFCRCSSWDAVCVSEYLSAGGTCP